MTKNEKRLMQIMLDDLSEILGNRGCNDLPPHWKEQLSEKEWIRLDKEFHEYNGDPEEHNNSACLSDFCVVAILAEKLEIELK